MFSSSVDRRIEILRNEESWLEFEILHYGEITWAGTEEEAIFKRISVKNALRIFHSYREVVYKSKNTDPWRVGCQ